MRNRLFSVVLITTLLAGVLTGCGNTQSQSTSDNKTTDSSQVTLKVGASLTPHSEILEQAKRQA